MISSCSFVEHSSKAALEYRVFLGEGLQTELANVMISNLGFVEHSSKAALNIECFFITWVPFLFFHCFIFHQSSIVQL